jgi:hypothetical protein
METLVRKYLPITVGIAAMLFPVSVLAVDLKPLEAVSVKAASDYVAAEGLNNLPIYRANIGLFFDATPFGPFTKFSLGVARTEQPDERRMGRSKLTPGYGLSTFTEE